MEWTEGWMDDRCAMEWTEDGKMMMMMNGCVRVWMDRCVNEEMDEWMDRCVMKWMDWCMDGRMDDRCVIECMEGWIGVGKEGWIMNEWMCVNGWMEEWIDRCVMNGWIDA